MMGINKQVPDKLYLVVKTNHNHFECGLHIKKSLQGAIDCINKGKAMTFGHRVKIIEVDTRSGRVMFDGIGRKGWIRLIKELKGIG